MAISLNRVISRPDDVAAELTKELSGVSLRVLEKRREHVVFQASFLPPSAFAASGYGIEDALLIVYREGPLYAFPSGPTRRWEHRNGDDGDLCLWYERDPRNLRWEWVDGFEQYVQIVYRHLFYEEFCRREGKWPVEAAPHGHGDHPIVTLEMKWRQQLWAPR